MHGPKFQLDSVLQSFLTLANLKGACTRSQHVFTTTLPLRAVCLPRVASQAEATCSSRVRHRLFKIGKFKNSMEAFTFPNRAAAAGIPHARRTQFGPPPSRPELFTTWSVLNLS